MLPADGFQLRLRLRFLLARNGKQAAEQKESPTEQMIKLSDSYKGINWDKEIEQRKSSVRCKVEHIFLIIKRQFGYAKVTIFILISFVRRITAEYAIKRCARIVEKK